MYVVSGELTVILVIIWWLQSYGNVDSKLKRAQNFDVERFNFKKLNGLEGRKQYQIQISDRFVVLENLNDREDIHRVWENIK
jgi:hypothetical protein